MPEDYVGRVVVENFPLLLSGLQMTIVLTVLSPRSSAWRWGPSLAFYG